MAKLYPRQRELVKLLIGGLIIKEAALKMGIARATANRYMAKARKQLDCAWQGVCW
jgi:DNA-binding CsgD family transcriptional regulator